MAQTTSTLVLAPSPAPSPIPNDPNSALRNELNTALGVIEPQIRGLQDLSQVSISGDLRVILEQELGKRTHRRDLINEVLSQLDSVVGGRNLLDQDGYPALEDVSIPEPMFRELQGEKTDLEAAESIFQEAASAVRIIPGTPEDKLEGT